MTARNWKRIATSDMALEAPPKWLTMKKQEAVAGVIRELGDWPAGTVISKRALDDIFHNNSTVSMNAFNNTLKDLKAIVYNVC